VRGGGSGGPLTADFASIQEHVFTPICTACPAGGGAPQGLRLDATNSYALLVGVPSNTRTKDDTRRWDGYDYELVRLTHADYAEMIRAGILAVSAGQAEAAASLGATRCSPAATSTT